MKDMGAVKVIAEVGISRDRPNNRLLPINSNV